MKTNIDTETVIKLLKDVKLTLLVRENLLKQAVAKKEILGEDAASVEYWQKEVDKAKLEMQKIEKYCEENYVESATIDTGN